MPPIPTARVIHGTAYTEQELTRLRHHCVTETQQAVFDLMVNGLNVFSVPYGSKGGTRWTQMQYTALNPNQIRTTFTHRCNLAVMMGFTSGNVFTLDAETHESLTRFTRAFEKHGIPIVCQQSGKPNCGGHLFVRVLEGEAANMPKNANRRDWEIRGHRNYVLVAPSRHPSGSLYRWTEGDASQIPTVSIEQLRWLGVELHGEREARRQHAPLSDLCYNSRTYIRIITPEGYRNDGLYKTGCDMSGCGYTREQAGAIAGAAAHRSGLDWPEIDRTLDSAYKEPRTPARQYYGAQANGNPDWIQALFLGLERKWEGPTAASDRAAYIAACLRARTANAKGVFRAACREVGEIGHVNKDTAAEALHRLQALGYVKFCGEDRSSQAYLYTLDMKQIRAERRNLQKPDTLLAPSWGGEHVRLLQKLLETDVVERGALGWSGMILYMNLVRAKKPLKVREMVEISGLTQNQVYRALDKLKEVGLAVKIEGTHTYQAVLLPVEELDERISRPRGKLGRSARRRAQHLLDRQKRAARILHEDISGWRARKRPKREQLKLL